MAQKRLRPTRMPVVPTYNPEAGLLTKEWWKRLWCRLRRHDWHPAIEPHEDHSHHAVVKRSCLRCGYFEYECVECDWVEDWW